MQEVGYGHLWLRNLNQIMERVMIQILEGQNINMYQIYWAIRK